MLGKVSKRSVGFDVCPQNIHKNRLPIKTHEVVKINSTVLQQSFSNKDLEWWLLYFFFLGVNVTNFLHLGSSQNKLFKPDEVACWGVFFGLKYHCLELIFFYLEIFPPHHSFPTSSLPTLGVYYLIFVHFSSFSGRDYCYTWP